MTPSSSGTRLEVHQRLVLKLLRWLLRSDVAASAVFGEAVVQALLGAKFELTVRQREAMLRACCSELRGTEVSPGFLDWLAEISGGKLHYSQEGEDIVLADLFAADKMGFFVDVGAHDAQRFSNTYALYRRGWRGINIDASPGSMRSFERLRTRDINIECAVSDADGPLTFHVFSEAALNTFDAALAATYVAAGAHLERTVQMVARSLASLLDEHLPPGQAIDLLNLDVEGCELDVLRSGDWSRHRPQIVIMEVLDAGLAELACRPSVAFLSQRGYVPISRMTRSVILRKAGA